MAPPRITVVTPSFNQASFLEATLLSVHEQGYPALEHLVLDGGSKDGSVDVLRRHAERLAFWRSEPDGGQAAAINEGCARATGSLVGWINSDDLLEAGSLAALGEAHAAHPDAILAGRVLNFDGRGREKVIENHGLTRANLVDRWPRRGWYHQPGVWFPRSVWGRVGRFDESLRYAFDLEWMLRALRDTPVVYLDCTLARFRMHPDQKTTAFVLKVYDEIRRVALAHLDAVPPGDVARVRAQLELDVASARLSQPVPDRRGGLRALAAAVRCYPGAVWSKRTAKLVGYALSPAGVAARFEEGRRQRHELGAGP